MIRLSHPLTPRVLEKRERLRRSQKGTAQAHVVLESEGARRITFSPSLLASSSSMRGRQGSVRVPTGSAPGPDLLLLPRGGPDPCWLAQALQGPPTPLQPVAGLSHLSIYPSTHPAFSEQLPQRRPRIRHTGPRGEGGQEPPPRDSQPSKVDSQAACPPKKCDRGHPRGDGRGGMFKGGWSLGRQDGVRVGKDTPGVGSAPCTGIER